MHHPACATEAAQRISVRLGPSAASDQFVATVPRLMNLILDHFHCD
jgi:hypothetical protein